MHDQWLLYLQDQVVEGVVYSLFEFQLNRPTNVYTETQTLYSMYASCSNSEAPAVQVTDKIKHKQLYI